MLTGMRRQLRRVRRFFLSDIHPPAYCENVEAWCKGYPAASCQRISEGYSVVRSLPLAPAETEVHWLFHKHQRHTFPAQYLAKIPDAKLVGVNGLIILPDGTFTVEPVYTSDFLKSDPAYRHYFPWEIKPRRGRYYSLLLRSCWSGNYYHWLVNVLQRLYRVLERLPDDVTFITPSPLRPYQLETLRILGIERRLAPFRPTEVWKFDVLFFSPPVALSAHHLPEALHWLRSRLMHAYCISNERDKPGRRLFISREKAQNRRIVNMDELRPVLERHGFDIVLAEELSLREQIELFAKANAIIAPHGAGLTNMLFARSDTVIIEIFGDQAVHYAYWTMSEALGYSYYYLIGKNIPNDAYAKAPRKEFYWDIYVPPEKLEQVINEALR